MFRVALLACLVVASLASPFLFDAELDSYWESFTATYNKQYGMLGAEPMRRAIWEKNLKVIREHNLQADMGQHTYRLGVNQYADWTSEEFVAFMNGYQMSNTTRRGSLFITPSNVQVPDEVDWRKEGYVTPVKNQEQCGSCWAFSTTGSTEGQHFKATNKLVSLSEQNLVDCSGPEGNLGCQGGLMDSAFTYIIKNKGIDTEASYPYTAMNGQCHYKAADSGATISGFTDIPSGDEDALKEAVATVGPISVAIDASHYSFQLYKTGVYNERMCSSTRLDHGVLAVGYGTQDDKDYWLVKNSWGESWGMDGYIMMSRNNRNQCGIATQASYPTV